MQFRKGALIPPFWVRLGWADPLCDLFSDAILFSLCNLVSDACISFGKFSTAAWLVHAFLAPLLIFDYKKGNNWSSH